ncbi:hypothetical protein [Vulcanimicrobium alpinum]|uniref:hypothetical protein n=1 Tax=Vulcanimicrobium alpinum TaxID=3016050 RepID=UPI00295F0A0B|nr:hypothetical protein [Vulcanimicrobium alpinum]
MTEAQKRAAERRLAAEQLLAQARMLEERIGIEAEQARIASARARVGQISAALNAAVADEHGAKEIAEGAATTLQAVIQEREKLQSRVDELRSAIEAAQEDVTALETRLADARSIVQRGVAAQNDASAQLDELARAEQQARAEAEAAEAGLRERIAAREQLEAELRSVETTVVPFSGAAPSLESIDMLNSLEKQIDAGSEASRRVAERRAADEARRRTTN